MTRFMILWLATWHGGLVSTWTYQPNQEKPAWVANRLTHDSLMNVDEAEEGSLLDWGWTLLRGGDILRLYVDGYLEVILKL